MLYVFYGADEFRRGEELRALRQEMNRDGNLAHNTTYKERSDVRGLTAEELRAVCHTASFFAEDRLVIVEGLLERLGGGRRRRGRGRGATGGAAASGEFDPFMAVLAELPPTTTVVLVEDDISDAVANSVPEGATVRKFDILRKRDQVRGWAAQRIKTEDANFAPGALERLLALFDGEHLGELAREIDKLTTYAGGRPVSAEDIAELVSGALAYEYWDLTDAVIEGRADRALAVLRKMDARDKPPQLLTFMLVRQYRQILLAQALLREGMSQIQIGTQMGLREYPLRKVIEQATRYPAPALEAAYRRLLESDVAVKTGVLDAAAALEILVVSLAELARAPRQSAGRR